MTLQHGALVESMKAFGYGLLAAGVVVVTVIYAVIYTRVASWDCRSIKSAGACELRKPCSGSARRFHHWPCQLPARAGEAPSASFQLQ
jgi:hypothetical protein